MNVFKSIEARKLYEIRVAKVINEAMVKDVDMRYEAIVEGRTGLAEMSESDLLEFGQDSWEVYPQGELK